MNDKYIPVAPDYLEQILSAITKDGETEINYFVEGNNLKNLKGKLKSIITDNNFQKFVLFDNGAKIRLDRIITLNGKPGPAFDEYDSYALACLDCTGGMD